MFAPRVHFAHPVVLTRGRETFNRNAQRVRFPRTSLTDDCYYMLAIEIKPNGSLRPEFCESAQQSSGLLALAAKGD
jgi:hypothetical protein